jgi:16S rRNA (guanine527-N7)-methyltransferase
VVSHVVIAGPAKPEPRKRLLLTVYVIPVLAYGFRVPACPEMSRHARHRQNDHTKASKFKWTLWHMETANRTTRLREPIADSPADRAQALAMFDVSRETSLRLDLFVKLLLAAQRHTNLISRSSIPSLWTRHIADSLQLLALVTPPAGTPPVWLDLGSGGGFPGVVLACALADIPGACVHLIESNAKKAAFLRDAVRETSTPAIVHLGRIEALGGTNLGSAADVITARAVAPLRQLCDLIAPILKKGAQALLPKGQDLDTELTEATKYWSIDAEIVPSKTSPTGRILVVRGLTRRKKS